MNKNFLTDHLKKGSSCQTARDVPGSLTRTRRRDSSRKRRSINLDAEQNENVRKASCEEDRTKSSNSDVSAKLDSAKSSKGKQIPRTKNVSKSSQDWVDGETCQQAKTAELAASLSVQSNKGVLESTLVKTKHDFETSITTKTDSLRLSSRTLPKLQSLPFGFQSGLNDLSKS